MRSSLTRWLLMLLVAATPTLVSCVLPMLRGKNILNFLPVVNDEVSYYHQVLTFRTVGFQGGYYTVNEQPPAAPFTHFYTFGPWYPALYGTIARITGWSLPTGLFINAVLVGLALLYFCHAAALNRSHMLLAIVFLSTFWGFLMVFFTLTQEALHYAIAIVSAALFYRLIASSGDVPIRTQLIGGVFLFIASLFRVSWAILFLPFFILSGRSTVWRWLTAAVASAVLTALVLAISSYVGAPGNNSIFTVLGKFSEGAGSGFVFLLNYFLDNARRFISFDTPWPIYTVQALQTTGLLVLLVGAAVWLWRRGQQSSRMMTETLFHLYNIAAVVLASFALYLVGGGGDWKLIAIHLMLSMLLLIAFGRPRLVWLFIATNLLTITIFWSTYRLVDLNHFDEDHSELTAFSAVAQQQLHYQPDAPTMWCNTLLFNVKDYSYYLTGVPGGIGLSFYWSADDPALTFKSGYLLLDKNDMAVILARPDPPDLESLAETSRGTIYRNRSAGCSVAEDES